MRARLRVAGPARSQIGCVAVCSLASPAIAQGRFAAVPALDLGVTVFVGAFAPAPVRVQAPAH